MLLIDVLCTKNWLVHTYIHTYMYTYIETNNPTLYKLYKSNLVIHMAGAF